MLITIQIPEGPPLEVRLDPPEGEVQLIDILPVLYDAADALHARVHQDLAVSGTPVSCAAGCGLCCRQLVSVSEDEALMLAAALAALPAGIAAQARERFDRTVRAMESHELLADALNAYNNAEHGSGEMDAVQRSFAALGLACPFLFEDKCVIYPVRPMLCREHNALSPPGECARVASGKAGVEKVRYPLSLATALSSFNGVEADYTKAIPLPLALLMRGRLEKRSRPKADAREMISGFLRFAAELAADRS